MTALAPSCHVVIITTQFVKFLHNCLGDSMTDGRTETDRADYNIPSFFFPKKRGDNYVAEQPWPISAALQAAQFWSN